MAYPFHRIEAGRSVVDWISTSPLNAKSFQRSPGWRNVRAATRRTVVEPAEPRILLSADFMPAAADAMSDGIDLFQARLDDFLASEAEFDQRLPFLLVEDLEYDTENPNPDDAAFEAPTMGGLFAIPVDANGVGGITGDENTLDAWDTDNNDVVDTAELLEALLFAPLEAAFTEAAGVDPNTPLSMQDFIDTLNDELVPVEDYDSLGGYSLSFTLDAVNDGTEEPDAEVVVGLDFTLTITRDEVPIDLGREADDLQLLAFTGLPLDPDPVFLAVDSTLTFGMEFGVYTGGQQPGELDAADFFIRKSDPMVFSVTAFDNDVDFQLNIGFLGAEVVDGEITLQADIDATLVDPDSPAALGFSVDQYGIEVPGGDIEADEALTDYVLAEDVGFVLRVGNLGIATDVFVTAASTADNSSNADLADDVQDAVNAAGLEGIVEVGVSAGKLSFALVDTNPGVLGFAAESLSQLDVLTAGGPPTIQPTEDVSFLLSVAGALPRLVTVRGPGTERDDIGFAETEESAVALIAQSAIGANGDLGNTGDGTAEFDLLITYNNGATTDDVTISVVGTVNGDITTLVQDVNDALGAAGVDDKVVASEDNGYLVLAGLTGVSALAIDSGSDAPDAEAGSVLGLAAGQQAFLKLAADNPIGDPTFDDGRDNTFDGARFTVTVNGSTTDIDVAADYSNPGRDAAGLAAAIEAALDGAGAGFSSVSVGVESGHIVLTADDASVWNIEVSTGNQDLDDLLYDLNNALNAAGFDGLVYPSVIAVDDGGGNIQLESLGSDSLEISNTLTFDAGVRGAELDAPPNEADDAYFSASVDEDSELRFKLPVEIKAGLHDPNTDTDWDPQGMAIIGRIDPFVEIADFVEFEASDPDNGDPGDLPQEVNRFRLAYEVNPGSGEDPLEPVPGFAAIPENTLELVNFAEALQFNRIGPGSFIGMLGELGAALDSIMQDPIFAGYDIPFADATLRDLAAFEDMIRNSIIYDLGPNGEFDDEEAPADSDDDNRLLARVEVGGTVIVPDGNNDEANAYETLPIFTTAQELGVELGNILSRPVEDDSIGINPTYNPTTNELTYDLDVISSDRVAVGIDDPDTDNPEFDVPFEPAFQFDLDLSPFGEFLITPEGVDGITADELVVHIESRLAFSATVGFDLTPQVDPELDKLEERFFVEDATMRGAFTAELPENGVAASALLGIVGVNIDDIDGMYGAQFSADIHDDGNELDRHVTLETIQQDIAATQSGTEFNDGAVGPGTLIGQDELQIVTDPVVTPLDVLDFEGLDSPLSRASQITSSSGGKAYLLDFIDDEDGDGTTGLALLFGVSGSFVAADTFENVRDSAEDGVVAADELTTPANFGELDMTVTVQDFPLGDPGYSGALTAALGGLSGPIDLDLVTFGDPNNGLPSAIDSSALDASLGLIGDLSDYAELGYDDVLAALQSLRTLVKDLEAQYEVLSQVLPVINRSVSDLLGLADGVDQAIASARSILEDQLALLDVDDDEVPTLTLQGMADMLRGAFGLADDSTGLVVGVEVKDGTPYLTLDFDIQETISKELGMDIFLGGGLPNLTTPEVLRADGTLGWGFKIGINLDDPTDVQLFNPEGGIEGTLDIVGEGAEQVGLVFLAQVGEAPVQVMDALVDIHLDFDLGIDPFGGEGIKSIGDVTFEDDFLPNITTQSFDVSIPLFDVNGGLTGFLGEILVGGDNIIAQAEDFLLNGLLDLDGDGVSGALDSLNDAIDLALANLDEFHPIDNLLLLTDLADTFFEILQDTLDAVTSVNIPIIGDDLANGARFIEEFRDQFINGFREEIENLSAIDPEAQIEQYIEGFFQGLELDIFDVDIPSLDFTEEIVWMLSLEDEYTVPFDLGFDLGVPLLSLESDIPIEVGLKWGLEIGLGVNQDDGAFIQLAEGGGKEFDVDLFVSLPPSDNAFRGTLGFLELAVINNGSGLNLDFDIDLGNSGGGDRVPISELGNLTFDTMIGGAPIDHNMNMDTSDDHLLDLTIEVGVLGADVVFPKLAADFAMDWSLDPQGLVDNLVQEGLELLNFSNVRLDLTSFLGGFLGDVLGELNKFLEPITEITDKLGAPIPILSDLVELVGGDPVTLLSLAETLGVADIGYLDAVIEILDLIGDIQDLIANFGDGEAFISLGDLEVFGAASSGIGGYKDSLFNNEMNLDDALNDAFGGVSNFLNDAGSALSLQDFKNAVNDPMGPANSKTQEIITDLELGDPAALIKFPFLENPQSILGLLVQQDITLVTFDIPQLGVGFDYEQFFTIFGPIGAAVGFGFYVGADFSLGFSTSGFSRFADSGFTNPGLIFDGFFFGDLENVNEGADIEEIFLEMTLTAAAEVNLGIASGGVGGGITARIGWDWYDPNNDGEIHISEIINTIENELRSGTSEAEAALSIFDLKGAILAELFWYLSINLGITKLEFGDTIFGPETILDFEYSFGRTPILATEVDTDGNDDPDTLIINAGPNALDRLNGDTSDGDESFEVEYDEGTGYIRIKSSTLGVTSWQEYKKGYEHIIFIGGQGNDQITFKGFDKSSITFDLQGGAGNDIIEFDEDLSEMNPAMGAGAVIYGGTGNDRLIGGHLNDIIYGGEGDDTIGGGRGYDILFGDSGEVREGPEVPADENENNYADKTIGVRISSLDGNDTINGGDADDIIVGGGGLDTLNGDAGADIIVGDGIRFGYEEYDGRLDVSAFFDATKFDPDRIVPDFDPNDRLDPEPGETTAQKMQKILLGLTGIFTGADLGAGADDTIDGGDGDDIIFGGGANDTIDGGADGDHIVGGKGFDTIDGNTGDDRLFGNEQDDTINGGDGSDVVSGGFGDDVLHGNDGNDYMTGSRGRDVMYGDEGDDEMHGEGEPDIMFGGEDNDLMLGGIGADIMMGDDGIVVKFDGKKGGGDLIIGDGNTLLADAYKAGADAQFGSLDLILTDVTSSDGNDILSGGEGGDVILGGGGNDLGGGDVDPRFTGANMPDEPTPAGADVLIGDGGVVEFNQRRLQRIASVFLGDPDGDYRDTLYGDNGNDVIIGGRGSDGDNDGEDTEQNIPSLGIGFMLTGGHGPSRGPTNPDVGDKDIIIGDNGELVYVGESDAENFGRLAYIQTTDTSNDTGGADTAFGEEQDDIILGGVNGSVDVLSGSTGQDVILGDNGLIHFYYDWEADALTADGIEAYDLEDYAENDGDPDTIDLIRSFHDGWGGEDIVSGQEDSDVLMGGEEGDKVFGDDEFATSGDQDLGDIMLGDNGDIFLEGDVGKRLVQGVAVDLITTTDVDEETGGADIMSGNAGGDVIIGGVNDSGIDKLYGDARIPIPGDDGNDLMLGDNGLLDYTWDAAPGGPDTDRTTLDLIETTARANGNVRGGVDYIFGNAGGDTAFGGTGADRLFGDNDVQGDDYQGSEGAGFADLHGTGGGADFLFGDQGRVELVNHHVTFITSTDADGTEGGADHIQGNAGGDFIIGGVAGDELHGEAFLYNELGVADLVMNEQGDDTIVGDQGDMRFNATDILVPITLTYTALGDGDPLTLDLVQTFATGNLDLGGSDEIYGNGGNDVAMGGADGDLIHGDFYKGSLVRALNPGDDDLLGDGGKKYFQNGHVIMLRSSETDQGGSDEIHGNDGNDTVIGGFDDDLLFGETDLANLGLAEDRAGEDIMLGDNGRLDWTLPDDDILGRQDVIVEFGGVTVTVDDTDPVADGFETRDRITTIAPTHGGNDVMYGNGNSSAGAGDVMFGGTGNDNMYGDSGDANPDGADGVDGSDVMFGDHGKLYPTLPGEVAFFVNNNFFSIDTAEADGADFDGGHNDFQDIMFGNASNDIMLGGQDDDVMFGGTGDDDMIGGHNVAGGIDELDDMSAADVSAIMPGVLSDLDPTDVEDINDIMDGGTDDDVMAGDNAIIVRQSDDLSPRFRITNEDGLLYTMESDLVDNLADIDVGFTANVTGDRQAHQDMTLVRTVTLLDHSEEIETYAADHATTSRVFGNDVMSGGSEDDEMFGQLGDDVMQGDGSITLNGQIIEANFDPFDPAQDADPSFDVRNFTQRLDLNNGNDLAWTINFDIDEDLADGDDYMEGNGGNDRMYGNLGQDDMIGGSSSLFGLGDTFAAFHGVGSGVLLRPDGADMIFGGAGNPDLLARNADVETGVNTIVPEDERHATDADTILGDNGDIFRIVVDSDSENPGVQAAYAVFNYDQDAITADGFVDDGYGTDDLTIRVRAVNLGDYGYSYVDDGDGRESLQFLPTARGAGDLIFGESGDDSVHGMTGDDVIFGGSEADDLVGDIGNDFILGGTGVDGILGDDGLIQTRRNSDMYGEDLYGLAAFAPEETNLRKNESPDPLSLNAEIRTPGNIQREIINLENELTKSVELFAFRTDDIEGDATEQFGVAGYNDILFGGLGSDFMHGGDGDDAVSGAEALPAYFSGAGFQVGPNQAFTAVNEFLQNMQESTYNPAPASRDNPFWFDFAPYNPGDILRFEGKEILDENGQRARTRDEFNWYDEFNPRRKLMFDFDFNFASAAAGDFAALSTLDGTANPIDFILNFNEEEGDVDARFSDEGKNSDGDDRIFGDLGNDWMVGGTGRDHMYGGRGNDLLNMDDDHDSGFTGRVGPHDPDPDPLDNKDSDEFQAYADIVYSGAGRDVMILNTGADRAMDWVGEFNSYIVPFSPFGAFHISRTLQPQVPEFLFALSASDGVDNGDNAPDGQLYVDQKNADVRTDAPDPARAYEPYGELGMVRQTDFDWQEQTGAPNDPQPGNLQGKREIMRRELFNDAEAEVALAADVGLLSLTSQGTLQAEPEALGEEVVGLYPLDTLQPQYTEILVTVNADKDKAGVKSNGYVIFDYQGPENFKFAGIDVGTDKLQIGHRDASGWVIDTQIPVRLKANTDYDLTVVLFGTQATVYVDQNHNVSFDFAEPLNDGGMVGLGTDNSLTWFDDLQIQTLPPTWTFTHETGFDATNPFTVASGSWSVSGGALTGSGGVAVEGVNVASFTRLELQGDLRTDGEGGYVFDYYSADEYKYVTLNSDTGEVLLGHYLNGQYYVDASVDAGIKSNRDYTVTLTMFGSTASVAVDGASVLTHSYNSLLNDGLFGVTDVAGGTSFDNFLVRGDDPDYQGEVLTASVAELTDVGGGVALGGDASFYDSVTLQADVRTGGEGGVAFDYSDANNYKYVTVDANNGRLIIGHYDNGVFVVDMAIAVDVQPDTTYSLSVTFDDDTVSVSLDGVEQGEYSYGESVMDGLYGSVDVSGDTALDAFLASSGGTGSGVPLMVSGGEVASDAEAIDSALIDHVADRAIALLDERAGVNGDDLADLPIDVMDLPGDRLAVWQGNRIVLDHNAAGHGWFAGVGGAADRIDLLSVLMHEYGHAIGLGHNAGIDFMADELAVGQRFAAKEQGAARVFDEDSGDFLANDVGVDDDLLVVESAGAPVDGLVSW